MLRVLTFERLTNPALHIEELPPIDFCVLSRYHGDYVDYHSDLTHTGALLDARLLLGTTLPPTLELSAQPQGGPDKRMPATKIR